MNIDKQGSRHFGSTIRNWIKRDKPEEEIDLNDTQPISFVKKTNEAENIYTIGAGGSYGFYYDIDGTAALNDRDQILKYREAAQQPEADNAISEIVNAAIVCDGVGAAVTIDLDNVEYTDEIIQLYKASLKELVKIQIIGKENFDYSHCYPRKKFDKQSIM